MEFPQLSEAMRIERLQPVTGPIRMVLDTDTYNEIDDQFAVVHALLSPETRLNLSQHIQPESFDCLWHNQ